MNKLMINAFLHVQNMLNNEEGQDLVEYGLVVALVALGSVLALKGIGTELSTIFSDISSTLTAAVS